MKIRRIIAAFAAVFVPFLLFRVGSGLTEQQNVTLRDYMVSENETTLTLHAAVFPPIEDIRDYKDEPKNGEHYLTFYNAFGSANTMRAGYTVVLPIEDKAVYFNDADGFHLVLQKNELTGEWVRP